MLQLMNGVLNKRDFQERVGTAQKKKRDFKRENKAVDKDASSSKKNGDVDKRPVI